MASKTVALFEFPFRPGVAPLASGYLQTVATADLKLAGAYDFTIRSIPVTTPSVLEKVLETEADVYGFSTYVWNARLVRSIVARLAELRPQAHIILGGAQVMHNAATYLSPSHPNVALCNGEGEHCFSAYLTQILEDAPDFGKVGSLSFYLDRELVTTENAPRIRTLDEIPSPYLGGLLDPALYNEAVFETNRGCPFKCTYCYWGGATNAKVHKFGKDRVLDELSWLCERQIKYVHFIDANFGILERDVEIAQHLVDCKKRTGFPLGVFFNSSKNTPARVTEITRMWGEVGIITAQPVSLQTMSPRALKAVERDNIKLSTYTALQSTLKTNGLQSFLEMIWPLPGETLESFADGLDQLCRLDTDAFVVYPLILINNVEMTKQREEHQLETVPDPSPFSEAEFVVSTSDVSNDDYRSGIDLVYQMTTLYTFTALRHTMKLLDRNGVGSFSDVAEAFWRFCQSEGKDKLYTRYVNAVSKTKWYNRGAGAFNAIGGAVHTALHADPGEFDRLLYAFLERAGWLSDDRVRLRLEIDLLNRPLLYSNSPRSDKSSLLRILSIDDADDDGVAVRCPAEYRDEFGEILGLADATAAKVEDCDALLRVDYRTASQIAFSKDVPLWTFYTHCYYRVRGDIGSIMPRWRFVENSRFRRNDERHLYNAESLRGGDVARGDIQP